MALGVSLGHQQLNPSTVDDIFWRFRVDGYEIEHGMTASGKWDYYSSIEITCDLQLEIEQAHIDLGITSKTRLGWMLVGRSSAMAKTISSMPYEAASGPQQIRLEIEPGNVGGKLTVELYLLVLESRELGADMFSPTKPGQVLYSTSKDLLLEGTGAQLPILPVSFREQGIPNSTAANWWLRVTSEDLFSSSNSALWLWINTDNDELTPLLTEPESPIGVMWLKFLSFDFARQVLQIGLVHEDLETDEEYPEGSLGQTLQSVVLLLGPSIESVRAKYRDDPSRVEAELQSIIGSAIG